MKKLILLNVLMISLVFAASGQVVDTTGISENPFDGGVTTTKLLSVFNVVYSALVILIGYAVKIFKVKYDLNLPSKRIPWVILAAGLVLAIAFISAGFMETLPALFSFLGAIGIYDFILKPAGLTVRTPSGELKGPTKTK